LVFEHSGRRPTKQASKLWAAGPRPRGATADLVHEEIRANQRFDEQPSSQGATVFRQIDIEGDLGANQ